MILLRVCRSFAIAFTYSGGPVSAIPGYPCGSYVDIMHCLAMNALSGVTFYGFI
jgi:hypothetical protein